MNILVTPENINQIVNHLSQSMVVSCDTETTGLDVYKGARAFSVIFADEKNEYYFNYNMQADHLGNHAPVALSLYDAPAHFNKILQSPGVVLMQNAKYDMSVLDFTFGVEIKRTIWDTWVLDRLRDNESIAFDLASIAKRHGFEKDDTVEKYMRKHKLENFQDVPFEIMFTYGCKDARITFDIANSCLAQINNFKYERNWPHNNTVGVQESELTPVLYEMEKVGVKIDKSFVLEALEFYTELIVEKEKEFEKITGLPFSKGTNTFKEVFKDETWNYTAKGNPKFDKKAITNFTNPAAKIVVELSKAKKQLDYFAGFVRAMDDQDVIHTNFCQAGTATGRFSSRNPNLQNLTNPDKYEKGKIDQFAVRKAFVPRPGFFFLMIDYAQIEYRVMLDKAGALGLIRKIIDGLDVHEASAQTANVTRSQAKTVNFMSLYGGGKAKLAADLGCTIAEATRIQDAIFNAAPEVKKLIRDIIDTASRRGFIFNQYGRRYHFKDSRFAYKAPNYLIQGTCADILKRAMIEIDKFLVPYKTRMILTIHDELVFEMPDDETHLIAEIVNIMTSAYAHKHLPLLVDVEWSDKNLAEKYSWDEYEKRRNKIQRENFSTP